MSAELQRIDHTEHITQAEILTRLVKIQDELYMIRRIMAELQADQANQRQEVVAVSMQQDQSRWEGQAP